MIIWMALRGFKTDEKQSKLYLPEAPTFLIPETNVFHYNAHKTETISLTLVHN